MPSCTGNGEDEHARRDAKNDLLDIQFVHQPSALSPHIAQVKTGQSDSHFVGGTIHVRLSRKPSHNFSALMFDAIWLQPACNESTKRHGWCSFLASFLC